MRPRRARDRRAVRRGITRDRPSLPRRSLNLFQPHGAGAGRYRRSARADVNQALPRPCRVDSSERHPGNIAKVSSMSDCLLCDWNRNRNFNVNRGLPAKCAGGAVRGIAVVFSSQPWTPLHRAAREVALRTIKMEGAGGIHAPLQHQVGSLSDEPKGASRNRERRPRAKRYQDRQQELRPHRPKSAGSRATEVATKEGEKR